MQHPLNLKTNIFCDTSMHQGLFCPLVVKMLQSEKKWIIGFQRTCIRDSMFKMIILCDLCLKTLHVIIEIFKKGGGGITGFKTSIK